MSYEHSIDVIDLFVVSTTRQSFADYLKPESSLYIARFFFLDKRDLLIKVDIIKR